MRITTITIKPTIKPLEIKALETIAKSLNSMELTLVTTRLCQSLREEGMKEEELQKVRRALDTTELLGNETKKLKEAKDWLLILLAEAHQK